MLKLRKNKKGFTLVELIVVIAIMAVLAGTVAGVTVSQLNKNTDKANNTQAKKIADTIYSELVELGSATASDSTTTTTTNHSAAIKTALEDAYGTSVFTWLDEVPANDYKGDKGKIYVWRAADTEEYHVKYFGKQSSTNGDVEYNITEEHGVQKGPTPPTASTGGTDKTETDDKNTKTT